MAKKHKYTLEEVKEYYKKALRVKCLVNGSSYKMPDINKIYTDSNEFRIETPRSYIRLSRGNKTELAIITSFKTPLEPNYEIY